MNKIIGYVEMKKKVGKIVFVVDECPNSCVKGISCEQIFLFDDVSLKISPDDIGKNIDVFYSRSFNGKAYVADIKIS